jgi:hypothetical protein
MTGPMNGVPTVARVRPKLRLAAWPAAPLSVVTVDLPEAGRFTPYYGDGPT